MIPALAHITLGRWCGYLSATATIDTELKDAAALPGSHRKTALVRRLLFRKAMLTAAYFTGADAGGLYADEVAAAYDQLCAALAAGVTPLPPGDGDISFGQFIDAKMIIQNAAGRNRFEVMRYVIALFYHPYHPENVNEDSEVFGRAGDTPMCDVLRMSRWFDEFNEDIGRRYSLFQDSGEDEGHHLRRHMERWGWVNFLMGMAALKVFDLPGMNSVDSVRATRLEDILTAASEKKDYSIALMRDMKKD